jgi:hypothetical protein
MIQRTKQPRNQLEGVSMTSDPARKMTGLPRSTRNVAASIGTGRHRVRHRPRRCCACRKVVASFGRRITRSSTPGATRSICCLISGK